jgi:two-component system sensor histidine kinase KdpD
MADDGRPDPDALLASLPKDNARGRLKIFLGAAPGVGKTWEMLNQARRRSAEFHDVLAGVIETHGRAETQAQIGELAVLPRRRVEYRGQTLEEFDLDGALAARPGLLLVDELAHTNAPGSRHAKRWEDVAELLRSGQTVWATLNVQHLESLNDDVARITGIRPTETLPDHVLELADEIELIDVPPAELRQRLLDGRIYRPDTAKRALDGFFKEGNLLALREIALRRTAAHVDSDVQAWMRRSGVTGPWPSAERVMALLGADASGDSVVRSAKRLADALHAPWIALHIERPTRRDDAARVPLALAAELGAEIEVRAPDGRDLPTALLEAARARNVTHILMGRSPVPWWRRMTGRSLSQHLLRYGPEFALHVVPVPNVARPPRRRVRREARAWLPWVGTGVVVAAVTGTGIALRGVLPAESSDMVYIAVVVAVAAAWGTGPAILAAAAGLLCWDFFFIPPLYTITINRPRDLISGAVFAFAAVLTGGLAGRVRAEVRAAGARIDSLRRIAGFSRRLGEPTTETELLAEVARQAAGPGRRAVVLAGDEDPVQVAAEPADAVLDDRGWAAARWSWTKVEPAGHGTGTLPSAAWLFLPMRTLRGRLGVLGVRDDKELDEPLLQALEALADQAAIAIERVRLVNEAARAAALEETQKLRTALLASLGHDLRTPLAGIQGAAGTLRGAWAQLSDETRADLLATIEDDVGRMVRFLTNITDLVRLETGEVRPRLGSVPLAEVMEAALSRLPNALYIATDMGADLEVQADAALLEQALVNVLDNAAKYSPQGAVVRVRARPQGQQISIAISDEGVGIPPDDLDRVFDSFFRIQRRDRTGPGIGLGLAITRGLIEAMGGTIAARSPNPDTARGGLPGTVVTIVLPRAAKK